MEQREISRNCACRARIHQIHISKEAFLYFLCVSYVTIKFVINRVVTIGSYSEGPKFESGSVIGFSGRGFLGFKSPCEIYTILPH
jgi:hypothetical protein